MARYRKYPKYEPKIGINESWANKLKKLSAQQLSLLIYKIIEYQKQYKEIVDRMDSESSFIHGVDIEILNEKKRLRQDMDSRHEFKTVFNKYIANWAYTEEQEDEMKTSLYINKNIKNRIHEALKRRTVLNRIIRERNKFVTDIYSDFLADSDVPIHLKKQLKFDATDLYEHTVNYSGEDLGSYNENDLKFYFETIKQSLYEIRKQVSKKEKSAKLASYEDKSRNVGQSLMSSMKANLKSPYHCPYCNKKTAKTKLHVDHINPVSNGGLSVERNLVPVCSECNLEKSDLSLRAFCKKNQYDFESICDTLESMGKFI